MKKNSFFGYVSLTSVKPATPNGKKSPRQELWYDLVGTGKCELGSSLNKDTNSWETEVREIDITFVNLSERQLGLLIPPAEILINGAQVITYMRPVVYHAKLVGIFDPEHEKGVADRDRIIANLAAKFSDQKDAVIQALGLLLPTERRVTTLRANYTDWSLQASSRQIATAQKVSSIDDFQ